MTMFMPSRGGGSGVQRLSITFDSGFGGCSANVVRAKWEGKSSITTMGLVVARPIEILSYSVGTASCSVQDGNVFRGGH
jgi:hypothetical protein